MIVELIVVIDRNYVLKVVSIGRKGGNNDVIRLSYTDSKSTSYTVCILRQYTCVHAVKGWFACIEKQKN